MDRPITVLALDGGGMRGLYSVALLQALAKRFSEQRNRRDLDIGGGFDLVVGTSTGGILAAAIVAGVPLARIRRFYDDVGPQVFSHPLPPPRQPLRMLWAMRRYVRRPGNSDRPLETTLRDMFGSETLGELHKRRQIGLCISTTTLLRHAPRLFKTPHRRGWERDNDIALVDACLATSAAPIHLPLAMIDEGTGTPGLFVDGGLWANNPVLVGLIEGLAVSAPNQSVIIVSIGTGAPNTGNAQRGPRARQRGALGWGAGLGILSLAMDAQGQAAGHAVDLLAKELERLGKRVHVLRCEDSGSSPEQAGLLQLDASSVRARQLMAKLGDDDGHRTFRWCPDSQDQKGTLLKSVFERMPRTDAETSPQER